MTCRPSCAMLSCEASGRINRCWVQRDLLSDVFVGGDGSSKAWRCGPFSGRRWPWPWPAAAPWRRILRRRRRATAPATAGLRSTDRRGRPRSPPIQHLFFEGNWHVTWRGNRKMSSAEVWLLKGLMLSTDCGTDGHYATCRDPQAPWFTSGVRAGEPGEAAVVWHQFQVEGTARRRAQGHPWRRADIASAIAWRR